MNFPDAEEEDWFGVGGYAGLDESLKCASPLGGASDLHVPLRDPSPILGDHHHLVDIPFQQELSVPLYNEPAPPRLSPAMQGHEMGGMQQMEQQQPSSTTYAPIHAVPHSQQSTSYADMQPVHGAQRAEAVLYEQPQHMQMNNGYGEQQYYSQQQPSQQGQQQQPLQHQNQQHLQQSQQQQHVLHHQTPPPQQQPQQQQYQAPPSKSRGGVGVRSTPTPGGSSSSYHTPPPQPQQTQQQQRNRPIQPRTVNNGSRKKNNSHTVGAVLAKANKLAAASSADAQQNTNIASSQGIEMRLSVENSSLVATLSMEIASLQAGPARPDTASKIRELESRRAAIFFEALAQQHQTIDVPSMRAAAQPRAGRQQPQQVQQPPQTQRTAAVEEEGYTPQGGYVQVQAGQHYEYQQVIVQQQPPPQQMMQQQQPQYVSTPTNSRGRQQYKGVSVSAASPLTALHSPAGRPAPPTPPTQRAGVGAPATLVHHQSGTSHIQQGHLMAHHVVQQQQHMGRGQPHPTVGQTLKMAVQQGQILQQQSHGHSPMPLQMQHQPPTVVQLVHQPSTSSQSQPQPAVAVQAHPVPMFSPAQSVRRIEERRAQRQHRVRELISTMQAELYRPDTERPFAGAKEAVRRLLPYHVFYEPDLHPDAIEEYDANLHRRQLNLAEQRRRLDRRCQAVFLKDALHSTEESEKNMLLFLDAEYEKRKLEEEKRAVLDDPTAAASVVLESAYCCAARAGCSMPSVRPPSAPPPKSQVQGYEWHELVARPPPLPTPPPPPPPRTRPTPSPLSSAASSASPLKSPSPTKTPPAPAVSRPPLVPSRPLHPLPPPPPLSIAGLDSEASDSSVSPELNDEPPVVRKHPPLRSPVKETKPVVKVEEAAARPAVEGRIKSPPTQQPVPVVVKKEVEQPRSPAKLVARPFKKALLSRSERDQEEQRKEQQQMKTAAPAVVVEKEKEVKREVKEKERDRKVEEPRKEEKPLKLRISFGSARPSPKPEPRVEERRTETEKVVKEEPVAEEQRKPLKLKINLGGSSVPPVEENEPEEEEDRRERHKKHKKKKKKKRKHSREREEKQEKEETGEERKETPRLVLRIGKKKEDGAGKETTPQPAPKVPRLMIRIGGAAPSPAPDVPPPLVMPAPPTAAGGGSMPSITFSDDDSDSDGDRMRSAADEAMARCLFTS